MIKRFGVSFLNENSLVVIISFVFKMTQSNKCDIYPSEWADNEVMDVLFSPFRENRYVNPRSWDRKIDFWKDMVRRRCVASKSLVFSARDLPSFFERSGKLPACMNTVLEDLVRYRSQ